MTLQLRIPALKNALVLLILLVVTLAGEACKPRNSEEYGAKSSSAGGCVNEITSRIDTMGIKVQDQRGGGGARVICVEPKLGLHAQYGMLAGDIIVGLNRKTAVVSVSDFADKLRALEADFDNPISAWEFEVLRAGQRLTLLPDPNWGGCIPESFNRCGSVAK